MTFKSTWTLYGRHHMEGKLNILSNALFFIQQWLLCRPIYCLSVPGRDMQWLYQIGKKKEKLQYHNSREQALYSDATNSFESSCQIFLSFLWGQENIGLAADALLSWSLWERCLAAVATFRPRVSWSLGESRGVLAITIGISPSAQPPPAHHLQTASRLHLASKQLFQI